MNKKEVNNFQIANKSNCFKWPQIGHTWLQIVLKEIPICVVKLNSIRNWEENKISTFNVTLNRTRKRQCNFLASLVITKAYLLLKVIQINYNYRRVRK